MWCSGGEIWVTEAPKYSEIVVGRRGTKEQLKGGGVVTRFARAPIKEVGGGREGIRPEGGRNVCLEQQRADAVIESAEHAFRTSILLRCVWTSEAKNNAVQCEECTGCRAIKFAAIVSLETHDGHLELSTNKRMKRNESGQNIGFVA